MIHDGLDLYNIAELRAVDGLEGLRLQRVPEAVRSQLDEGTAGTMLSPAGGEIRFRIADGHESVTLRLSAELPTNLYAYHGPFQGRSWVLDSEPQDIIVKQHPRIRDLTKENYPNARFDPHLFRLCFGGAYPEPVFYHGHGDGISLPGESDVPEKRYLAYGSSITHGTDHSGAGLSYPAHAAWRLGLDLRNLGASGCCLCEKAMADYLAEQSCDVVTLELSVNMLGRGFSAEAFSEKARYLVERIADSDPQRPVVCITIFPYYRDIDAKYAQPNEQATPEAYRAALRKIVETSGRPNIMLLEGPDLLQDIGCLSHDLIHPGLRGMLQIGDELARRLRELL